MTGTSANGNARNELQQLGIGNGKQKRRRRRARAKAKREGFEAQCGLEEPTQMSRALGNNSDDDACEGGSTDAEASLSDTRCLTSAQIGNPWYGRVALAAGLALVGGSGTDTKGTDMVSAPDGPDWSKHRYCLDDRRNRHHRWRVPTARAGIRQPWRFGEQLMVEVPRPGYVDYYGHRTEQAVTLRTTIERTD